MAAKIEIGTVAEYTCDETWGDKAGQILTGDVVKVGKTYADVTWRESDRTERVHFRNKHEMSAITFTAETAEQSSAARREQFNASLPFLYRQTEQRRIEAEHDPRADLVHQGRRTSRWYRTVAAVLRVRTVEIDRMVAALRPGDQVRQVDDPAGTVWIIREIWEGNDGWVWLSLRRLREDGTEVWTGCRARAVDLVTAATDDQHAAEVEAKLHDDHRVGWLSDDEYAARLERIRSTADPVVPNGPGPDGPGPDDTRTQTQTRTPDRPEVLVGSAVGPGPGPVSFGFRVQTRTDGTWRTVRTGNTPPIFRPVRTVLDAIAETVLGNAGPVLGLGPTDPLPPVRVQTWHQQSGLTGSASRNA